MCTGISPGAAKEISFQADVDRTIVELGSYLRLTLTVTGVDGLDQPIELPQIDGLESRLLGPQTRVSIINGQYSSSYSLVYFLYPLRVGTFKIPSLTLTVENQTVQSEPITIEAVGTSQAPVASGSTSEGGAQQGMVQQNLSERIFVVLEASRNDVYVNERFDVTVKLFVNGMDVRNISYPQIKAQEFFLEDFQQPAQYEQVLEGVRYQVVEFKTFAYALQPGAFDFGPAEETCQLAIRGDQGRQKGFGGFFEDDFFNDFFGRNYILRPLTISSKTLQLTIRPLPLEGRPADFSGAVGKFVLDAVASPLQLKVGDPITTRLTLAGNGNMRTAEIPIFKENGDFKAYEPQVTVKGNVKISEQVIIPKHSGVKAVPAVSFWSFNPETARYEEQPAGPFALNVAPLEVKELPQIVGSSSRTLNFSNTQEDVLGKDISFIKDRPGRFYDRGYQAWRSIFFGTVLALILMGWGFGYVWHRFSVRVKTDERFAGRLKAPYYARRGLKDAERFLASNDVRGFYDAIHATVQQYFRNRLHKPLGSISASNIRSSFQGIGVQEDVVSSLERLLVDCDAARYASAQFNRDRMERTFQDLRRAIDQIERKCRLRF